MILIDTWLVSKQVYSNVVIAFSAAGCVLVQEERLLYVSMVLVKSSPPETGAPTVSRSGACFLSSAMVRAKDSMNFLWSYALMDEGLAVCTAQVVGKASEEPVRPLELALEVDPESWVDILILFVAVWRWDGGSSGELAVIGDLRLISSLWVFERGVRSIGALFEVSSLFHSFLSPASPPLTVFSPTFTTSQSSLLASCHVVYI